MHFLTRASTKTVASRLAYIHIYSAQRCSNKHTALAYVTTRRATQSLRLSLDYLPCVKVGGCAGAAATAAHTLPPTDIGFAENVPPGYTRGS